MRYYTHSFQRFLHRSSLLIIFLFFGQFILSKPLPAAIYPNPLLPGVRASGMGYAYTAVVEDNLSFFWNPAGLSVIPRQQFSIGLAQDQHNPTTPFYPQYVVFSWPQRLKGAWAVGGYAIHQERAQYAIAMAHSRRLTRYLRIGLSLFHLPDFTHFPTKGEQWGFSTGIIFQPNLKWRLGCLFHSTVKPLYNQTSSLKDEAWVQARVGLSWRFNRHWIYAMDFNPLNRSIHGGFEFKLLRFGAFRAGISSFIKSQQPKENFLDNLTFHAGFSFGLPGFEYAAIKRPNTSVQHAVSINSNFGTIIRQIQVKPYLFEIDQENTVGFHVLQTPNMLAEIPEEINYRLSRGQKLNTLTRQFGKHLAPECLEDTLAIRTYNNWPENRAFQPRQPIRVPLFQWAIHDSAKADSIKNALDNALIAEPGHWPSYQNMGMLSQHQDKIYAAEEQIGKAMTLASHKVQTLLTVASFRLKEKNWKEAYELLSDAALLDSTNWLIQANLGYVHLRANQFREAEIIFKKAIKLGDKTPSTQYYLAECLQNLGRLSEAEIIRKNLAQQHPKHFYGKISKLKIQRPEGTSGRPPLAATGSTYLAAGSACTKVANRMRTIEGENNSFPSTVGRVYVWVRFRDVPAGGMRVVPKWYWQNKLIFEGKRGWRVGASGRTYGYKTIHKNQVGVWHVDFYQKDTNQYLGRIDFTVYPAETPPTRESNN